MPLVAIVRIASRVRGLILVSVSVVIASSSVVGLIDYCTAQSSWTPSACLSTDWHVMGVGPNY